MVKEIPPRDHFSGFSSWSLNEMGPKFSWSDIDMSFLNDQTGQPHVVETKCFKAEIRSEQIKIFEDFESRGIQTHILRMDFPKELYGNHTLLGDPRRATRILFDDTIMSYEVMKRKFLKLHGVE